MSRTYGEPVQVRPGRTAGRSGSSGGAGSIRSAPSGSTGSSTGSGGGAADSGEAGDAGTEHRAGQPELVFWRVEAAPGQGMTPAVYELRQDVATTAWTIRLT